jgi:hypothetical protein
MANLFDVVKALQPEDVDKGVTVNQVRDKLKRGDRTTIWRQLKKLEEGRYLENLAHYGATARYRTAGRRPKPMNVLPTKISERAHINARSTLRSPPARQSIAG